MLPYASQSRGFSLGQGPAAPKGSGQNPVGSVEVAHEFSVCWQRVGSLLRRTAVVHRAQFLVSCMQLQPPPPPPVTLLLSQDLKQQQQKYTCSSFGEFFWLPTTRRASYTAITNVFICDGSPFPTRIQPPRRCRRRHWHRGTPPGTVCPVLPGIWP